MIQLPIILIHMASLDVPTNSVAQVAAAIEEKRNPGGVRESATKDKPNSSSMVSSTADSTTASDAAAVARGSPRRRVGRKASQNMQGRAFAAPRSASIERSRAHRQDLHDLSKVLDRSPRKFQNYQRATSTAEPPLAPPTFGAGGDGQYSYNTPPHNRRGALIRGEQADELRQQLGSDNDTTRSFKVIPSSSSAQHAEGREPSRSASAMGYYMPGDARSKAKENRRPSLETRPSERARHDVDARPSLDVKPSEHGKPAGDARSSTDMVPNVDLHASSRPRPSNETDWAKHRKEWRDGGRSPVGGVQLAGVPEAPKRNARSPVDMKPNWAEGERLRWRPHWL